MTAQRTSLKFFLPYLRRRLWTNVLLWDGLPSQLEHWRAWFQRKVHVVSWVGRHESRLGHPRVVGEHKVACDGRILGRTLSVLSLLFLISCAHVTFHLYMCVDGGQQRRFYEAATSPLTMLPVQTDQSRLSECVSTRGEVRTKLSRIGNQSGDQIRNLMRSKQGPHRTEHSPK
jgi:hypothetical protein